MFFMTNDGQVGQVKNSTKLRDQATLVQRMFVFRLLVTEGIAVSLLKGVEFRDMKVLPLLIHFHGAI